MNNFSLGIDGPDIAKYGRAALALQRRSINCELGTLSSDQVEMREIRQGG
jgi:hypothetical protein